MKYQVVKTYWGQRQGEVIDSFNTMNEAKAQIAREWSFIEDRCCELSNFDGIADDGMSLRHDNFTIEVVPVKSDTTEVEMSTRRCIGHAITCARNDARLTIRQLAELSGVHYTNIAKIEAGRYNVSIDILSKIATALGKEIKLV